MSHLINIEELAYEVPVKKIKKGESKMSTSIFKNYLLRAKSALNKNLSLTFLDRVKLSAGIVPAKTGLIYDQLQFPGLSIQEIERLSDFQGGFYYPPKHRRKSMAFLIKAVEKGTLLN